MESIKLNKQTGFTLIEIMMVVAIIGVLLTIGIPSYNILKNNNCLVTNSNRLVASLQFARSESAKRNRNVSLRPIDGAWRNGFQIVMDEDQPGCSGVGDVDGSGTCTNDAVMKIIELGCGDANIARGLQIENLDSAGSASVANFTYRSSGRLTTSSQNRRFGICMAGFVGASATDGNERGRVVAVSNIGRPSTTRVDITACPILSAQYGP